MTEQSILKANIFKASRRMQTKQQMLAPCSQRMIGNHNYLFETDAIENFFTT